MFKEEYFKPGIMCKILRFCRCLLHAVLKMPVFRRAIKQLFNR